MPKPKFTRKQITGWLSENVPGLRFEKPVGLPRGAKWAIKPATVKEYIFKYDEGEYDPATGKFMVTITVPFELEYEYQCVHEPAKMVQTLSHTIDYTKE